MFTARLTFPLSPEELERLGDLPQEGAEPDASRETSTSDSGGSPPSRALLEQGSSTFENALDAANDKRFNLINSWSRNGQVIGESDHWTFQDEVFHVVVTLTSDDALEPDNDSPWAARERAELPNFTVELLGRDPTWGGVCTCAEDAPLYLSIPFPHRHLPLSCWTCGRAYPQYRLPQGEQGEHVDLVLWAGNALAFWNLWITEPGADAERFALEQLQSYASEFMRFTRATARALSQRSGRTVLAPILRLDDELSEVRQGHPCPGCGGDWLLPEPHHSFWFHCADCGLVS